MQKHRAQQRSNKGIQQQQDHRKFLYFILLSLQPLSAVDYVGFGNVGSLLKDLDTEESYL